MAENTNNQSPDNFCIIDLKAELESALNRAMSTADLLAALTLPPEDLKPGTVSNAGVCIFQDLLTIEQCCARIAQGVKNGQPH